MNSKPNKKHVFVLSALGVFLASAIYAQSLPLNFGGGGSSGGAPFDGGAVSYTATAASGSMAFSQKQGAKHCFDADTNAKCEASDGTTLTVTGLNLAAGNLSGTNTGDVTLGAVAAVPNANGASIASQVLTLQPADATNPGVVTTGTQTFAGAKTVSSVLNSTVGSGSNWLQSVQGARLTFDGATGAKYLSSDGTTLTATGLNFAAGNFSGSNTGDLTLTAIGASANANGATLTAQALNLQPASASFGGVVTTGVQTMAGAKTWSGVQTVTANPAGAKLLSLEPVTIANGDALFSATNASAVSGGVKILNSSVSATQGSQMSMANVNTTSTADTYISLSTASSAAGDAYVQFIVSGQNSFGVGIDNSDSDTFKVSSGGVLGSGDVLRCTATSCGVVGSGGFNIGSSGTVIKSSIAVASTQDFGSISAATCADSSAVTVTGATTTSTVELGVPNAAQVTGSIFQAWVSSTNNVTIRHCCAGAATCDPASGSFGIRVNNN